MKALSFEDQNRTVAEGKKSAPNPEGALAFALFSAVLMRSRSDKW